MSAETGILAAAASLTGADRIGALEKGDRTAIMIASGKCLGKYLDGTQRMQADIMIGGRDKDQKAIMSDMAGMCGILCRQSRTIKTDDYYVFSAKLLNAPAPYGMSETGEWFYRAVVQLIYIIKNRS